MAAATVKRYIVQPANGGGSHAWADDISMAQYMKEVLEDLTGQEWVITRQEFKLKRVHEKVDI